MHKSFTKQILDHVSRVIVIIIFGVARLQSRIIYLPEPINRTISVVLWS